jgi:hypothetical protein
MQEPRDGKAQDGEEKENGKAGPRSIGIFRRRRHHPAGHVAGSSNSNHSLLHWGNDNVSEREALAFACLFLTARCANGTHLVINPSWR